MLPDLFNTAPATDGIADPGTGSPNAPADDNNIAMSEEGDPSHDDSLDLVFSPNSTDLSLNNQHERVARLLRATITKVQLDLVFVNAFPQELLRNVVVPNALIAVAHNLNDPAMAARIHDDRDYRRAVAKIVGLLPFKYYSCTESQHY